MTNAAWAFTNKQDTRQQGLLYMVGAPFSVQANAAQTQSARVNEIKNSQIREAEMKRCRAPAQQAKGAGFSWCTALVRSLQQHACFDVFVRNLRSGL